MKKEKTLSRPQAITMILALLREEPLHGYGIMRQVEEQSTGLLTLDDGNLYTLLRDMEDDGLITSSWVQVPGERQRRMYTITDSGLGELERQVEAWREFTSVYDRMISKPSFSWGLGLWALGGEVSSGS